MNNYFIMCVQLIIALGLINVWIFRFNKVTAYRGGDAKNLVDEFKVYGLPAWFCYFIGFLKLGSAFLLLLGFYFQQLIFPASALVVALMAGAVSMHLKVNDPIKKALPASAMLLMSLLVCGLNL